MDDAIDDLTNGRLPFQRKVGVNVQARHTDGVDLMVPFDPQNLSVPEVLSAGVAYLLAETAGAAVVWMVLSPRDFGLLARTVEIRYLRPANFNLWARPRTADIVWETSEDVVRRDGRGRVTVPVDITGPDGRPVAKARAQYAVVSRDAGP